MTSTDRLPAVSLATFDFAEYNNKMMYMDAYSAITQLDLWPWLSAFTPHEKKGFMIYDPTLCKIEGALKTGHSGVSFAFVMRAMKYISNYGYLAFEEHCKLNM